MYICFFDHIHMLRHTGKGRTYQHNLKLASILSAVAGIVNITGVLSLNTLTTNVTGHFAFFSEQVFFRDFQKAFGFLLYILCFLFGAFTSSLFMEWRLKKRPHSSYVVPLLIEMSLLGSLCLLDQYFKLHLFYPVFMACVLLFAMGLQNALVTRVSQSVVRTTHLTGLFTDLGIELSQLLFYRETKLRSRLYKSLILKSLIISSFFGGGIVGALTYTHLKMNTLLLPVALLLFAMRYDALLFRFYALKRRFRDK